MDRRHVLLGALAFCTALAGGCSSEEDSTANVDFRGVYRPANAGNISAISFKENKHYMLMTSSCRSQGCAELGTYRFDRARSELALTNAATGTTRTLSVKVLATEGAVTGGMLTTKAGMINGGKKLTDKTEKPLDKTDEKLIEKATQLIDAIKSAMMDGQQMDKDDKGGDGADEGDGDDKGDEKPNCNENVPTDETPKDEADAYWAKCPEGIAKKDDAKDEVVVDAPTDEDGADDQQGEEAAPNAG